MELFFRAGKELRSTRSFSDNITTLRQTPLLSSIACHGDSEACAELSASSSNAASSQFRAVAPAARVCKPSRDVENAIHDFVKRPYSMAALPINQEPADIVFR